MSSLGANLTEPNYTAMTDVVKSQWQYYTATHTRTPQEIGEWMQKHMITIYGERVPQPLFSFQELVAPEPIHRAFQEAGYESPTAIQSAAWPILLQSRDFVGVAKTGSGKTLGFMVPAILHILGQQPLNQGDGPIVLVLAPTRELAVQIEEESRKVTSRIPQLRTTCLYGGVPKHEQSRALRHGVHVCIATPGRLIDMLASKATNLFRVTFLVLDEADRMLDMGFEPQIRQVCGQIRPDRQTLMFSATWPQEIRSLAASFQRDFIRIHIGSEQLLANSDVRQHFFVLEEYEKNNKLMEIFRLVGRQRMLIFTKTKKMADLLYNSLVRCGVPAMVIHGDKDQHHRDRTLERFKNEPAGCLVATDVAARGLDIKNLDVVVNYDFSTNIEDYVHRIGRTGRAGNKGDAYTFLTHEEPAKTMRELCDLLRRAGQTIPPEVEAMSMGRGGYRGRGGYNSNYGRGGAGHNHHYNQQHHHQHPSAYPAHPQAPQLLPPGGQAGLMQPTLMPPPGQGVLMPPTFLTQPSPMSSISSPINAQPNTAITIPQDILSAITPTTNTAPLPKSVTDAPPPTAAPSAHVPTGLVMANPVLPPHVPGTNNFTGYGGVQANRDAHHRSSFRARAKDDDYNYRKRPRESEGGRRDGDDRSHRRERDHSRDRSRSRSYRRDYSRDRDRRRRTPSPSRSRSWSRK